MTKESVAYIVGTGLTMATANRSAFTEDLSLEALCRAVIREIRNSNDLRHSEMVERLINWLSVTIDQDRTPNLEELIEHLLATGVEQCEEIARLFSKRFAEELGRNTASLVRHLDDVDDLSQDLAAAILEYHEEPECTERLLGVITTNYDTLIERALSKRGKAPNYGFELTNSSPDSFPLYKLHGSLNWEPRMPVGVGNYELSDSLGPLWIGPRRSKLAREYPFNIIWGRARELLAKVDIVRVVGASLRPPDWHITQLLFLACQLDSGEEKAIEVINSAKNCERIQSDYPLLPINGLHEMENVVRFHRNISVDAPISEEDRAKTRKYLWKHRNTADYWLQSKIDALPDIRSESLMDFLG